MTTSFTALPQEISQIVFSFLDTLSLSKAEFVCKSFRNLIRKTAWQVNYTNTHFCESPWVQENRNLVMESIKEWYEHVTSKDWEFASLQKIRSKQNQRFALLSSRATPREIAYAKNLRIACWQANVKYKKKLLASMSILKQIQVQHVATWQHWTFLLQAQAISMIDRSVVQIVGTAAIPSYELFKVVHDAVVQAAFFKKHPQVTRAAVFVLVLITSGYNSIESFVISEWDDEATKQSHFTVEKQHSCALQHGACYQLQVFWHSQITVFRTGYQYHVVSNYAEKIISSFDMTGKIVYPQCLTWIPIAKNCFELRNGTEAAMDRYVFSLKTLELTFLHQAARMVTQCDTILVSPSGYWTCFSSQYPRRENIFPLQLPSPNTADFLMLPTNTSTTVAFSDQCRINVANHQYNVGSLNMQCPLHIGGEMQPIGKKKIRLQREAQIVRRLVYDVDEFDNIVFAEVTTNMPQTLHLYSVAPFFQ